VAAGFELSLRPHTPPLNAEFAAHALEQVLDLAEALPFTPREGPAPLKFSNRPTAGTDERGAIALAYCIEEPRGTRDLDVNVFSAPSDAARVLTGLPGEIKISPSDVEAAAEEGQRRLWWDGTPIDVFLNSMEFHEEVAQRVLWVPLAGRTIPVIDCRSLVVFKALIDRTRDWADIEACVAVCDPLEMAGASIALGELLDENDPRLARLEGLRRSSALRGGTGTRLR
jgi:hypothetical protein